uniref:Uncharacterized protein n=1 Tax=Tanacetum cinerariifolium TaxID=118510 RepID=A0A6L2L2Q6_TANCI|nr:hypothetical protein [Tanacetum cinerariifolium]
MLSNQKPSCDKLGLRFNSFEASSSGTKKTKFMKAQKKAFSDGGLINMGGLLSMQEAPKAIMGPPTVATPGSKKSVSFHKSILGPGPKHIIVNNVKVPIASDNEVKQFYKPLSKLKSNFSFVNVNLGMDSRQKWSSEDQRDIVILRPRLASVENGITLTLAPSLLGKGTVLENMLLRCDPDTTYGLHHIQCILDESALVVEIDFKWSLGFGSVEPGKARISLMMFEFSSCLFAESAMNLVDRVLQTACNKPLLEYSLLPLVGSLLCQYAVLITQNMPYCLEEHICYLNCRSQYAVMSGKVDTSLLANSKACIILNKHTRKFEESLNVTFDETPPSSKTSPLVDDDLDEEEAIKVTEKKNLENDIEDEILEIDEIVNIKESMSHPL